MQRLISWFDRIPCSLLALLARVAAAVVFWRSGRVKLDDWSATLALFETEYRLPLLLPQLAACLATGLELGGSVLLLLGLGTRFAALAFIGMVATIQGFVYPQAWPTHLQWLAFVLPLLARGAGAMSLDAVLVRWRRP